MDILQVVVILSLRKIDVQFPEFGAVLLALLSNVLPRSVEIPQMAHKVGLGLLRLAVHGHQFLAGLADNVAFHLRHSQEHASAAYKRLVVALYIARDQREYLFQILALAANPFC